ncbi:peptide chain release factor aRF-1, partial [Candidatus Micrarchaeota archaeon]|nr:peptide chain release factor aRF-1 [Candidatus Micrarchaeota archaeon]
GLIWMAQHIEEVSGAELAVFRKKIAKLEQYRGRGTELITQYVPEDADRGTVMGLLTEEISQSSNIKSPSTRKNVQGALRKIIGFLKQIDFKIPKRGIVVFAGNVSKSEGKTDIRLFTVQPPSNLNTKMYWCDSEFHLAPLKEMMQPTDVYGLATIDKNESTIAILLGKKYEILAHFTSQVAGKSRAGGQSAKRFEHLREEAAQDFYKRISGKINDAFLPYGEKLKGIIIGGPGITKNYFLNKDMIDHRLKGKIIGQVDTSYTDDSGIREMVQRSEELLKDTDMMKERALVNKFMGEVAKDALATYGEAQVMQAIKDGQAEMILLSEDIDWMVYRFTCNECGHSVEKIVKEVTGYSPNAEKCEKCGSAIELMEEVDYLDWMLEKAHSTGAEMRLISTETPEGEQFFRTFAGIGAILRYR